MARYNNNHFLAVINKRKAKLKLIIVTCFLLGILGAMSTIYDCRPVTDKQQMGRSFATQDILQNENTFYDGISIGGISLCGKSKEEAKNLLASFEKPDTNLYKVILKKGGKYWKINGNDLAFSTDLDAVIKEAYNYARTEDTATRVFMMESLKKDPKDFEVHYKIDEDSLKKVLDKIEKEINVLVKEPSIGSFNEANGKFVFIDGKTGIKVKSTELYDQVKMVLLDKKIGVIEIPVEKTEPSTKIEDLKKQMTKLITYSTMSTNSIDGTHNMFIATKAINRKVLASGAEFSFNGTTGNSTNSFLGYRPGIAIIGGKKELQYGGGICQVSSTLYGAVIRTDLQITKRSNHLWPSSYVPIGLDATIDYPGLDFRFKNTSKYPIYISGTMSGKIITIALYGYQSPYYDKIEVKSWQTGTIPQPADQYMVDKKIKKGEKELVRKGNPGRTASAQRIFYQNGMVVKKENLPDSRYRSISNIWKICSSMDCNSSLSGKASSSSSNQKEPVASTPVNPVSNEMISDSSAISSEDVVIIS